MNLTKLKDYIQGKDFLEKLLEFAFCISEEEDFVQDGAIAEYYDYKTYLTDIFRNFDIISEDELEYLLLEGEPFTNRRKIMSWIDEVADTINYKSYNTKNDY